MIVPHTPHSLLLSGNSSCCDGSSDNWVSLCVDIQWRCVVTPKRLLLLPLLLSHTSHQHTPHASKGSKRRRLCAWPRAHKEKQTTRRTAVYRFPRPTALGAGAALAPAAALLVFALSALTFFARSFTSRMALSRLAWRNCVCRRTQVWGERGVRVLLDTRAGATHTQADTKAGSTLVSARSQETQ